MHLWSAIHSLHNFVHASFWAVTLLHLVSWLFHFSSILLREKYLPHYRDISILQVYTQENFSQDAWCGCKGSCLNSRFKCFWLPILCSVPIFNEIMFFFFFSSPHLNQQPPIFEVLFPPLFIPDLETQLAAAPTLLPRTRFSLQKHIRSSLNLH